MNKQLARGKKTTGRPGCPLFFARAASLTASVAVLIFFAACREPAAADDPVTWEPIGAVVSDAINW